MKTALALLALVTPLVSGCGFMSYGLMDQSPGEILDPRSTTRFAIVETGRITAVHTGTYRDTTKYNPNPWIPDPPYNVIETTLGTFGMFATDTFWSVVVNSHVSPTAGTPRVLILRQFTCYKRWERAEGDVFERIIFVLAKDERPLAPFNGPPPAGMTVEQINFRPFEKEKQQYFHETHVWHVDIPYDYVEMDMLAGRGVGP